MRQNPKFLADLVTLTEELLHAKFYFLFSVNDSNYARELITCPNLLVLAMKFL